MEHPITIAAGTAQHAREAARDSLFLSAAITRLSDGSDRIVRVRNLSAGGLMADCVDQFARADAVIIALRGIGEVRGRVAWQTADKIGVSFDSPIDPKLARKPVGNDARSHVPMHVRAQPQGKRPPVRRD